MIKLLKDCLTGPDNETYDVGAIAFLFSLFALFIFQAIEVTKGHDFDPVQFGACISTICLGYAPYFYIKEKNKINKDDK
jgi:hypothetical protein